MTIKDKSRFHPLEISICGYSNSGKTTLIEKLIKHFSKKLKVGYVKHDAHRFEMDKAGKDTHKASEAGAKTIVISSPEKTAIINYDCADQMYLKQNLLDQDVVLIEGYKESLGDKILVWSETEDNFDLLESYLTNPAHNLLTVVGKDEEAPTFKLNYLQRDEIAKIAELIEKLWLDRIAKRPLYGLILTGGKSKRMGLEKGALLYHNKTQVEHLEILLKNKVEKVFTSCRAEQSDADYLKHSSKLVDTYIGQGPAGGILSAFQKHPEAAWLVLACDMPFINEAVIDELIEKRNPYRIATCFFNGEKKWPEPLCTIYEPKAAQKLGLYLAMGKPCPRKVLMNSSIELLDPLTQKALDNANTPEDFKKIKDQIDGGVSEG